MRPHRANKSKHFGYFGVSFKGPKLSIKVTTMKYEIPREMFKQRLEERLNFVFVDLLPTDRSPVKFEKVIHINYNSQFKDQFSSQFPNKNQNVILYSLEKGDDAPSKAANDLAELGYNFVYFYNGSPGDLVLDKGLN